MTNIIYIYLHMYICGIYMDILYIYIHMAPHVSHKQSANSQRLPQQITIQTFTCLSEQRCFMCFSVNISVTHDCIMMIQLYNYITICLPSTNMTVVIIYTSTDIALCFQQLRIGGVEHFLFSHRLGLIIFRGVGIPPTSNDYLIILNT